MISRAKRAFFVALAVVIVVALLEAGLSVVFFQRAAPEPLAIVHFARHLIRVVDDSHWPAKVGIWQVDDRFGFSHIPNSSGVHATADFEVTYTIGPDQERLTAPQSNARGKVVFLGGSITFGQGVGDDETFPALLAGLWGDWNTENRAVIAWGTSQAYLVLDDVLEKGDVAAVVYGLIPHHLHRNYLRKSWVDGVTQYGMKLPHFELTDRALEFRGVVGSGEGMCESDALRQTELALTASFLSGMKQKCDAAGVAFVVVLLPRMTELSWPPQLIRQLDREKFNVLDLTELRLEHFDDDGHPNPRDHALIARSIHESFVTDLLQ